MRRDRGAACSLGHQTAARPRGGTGLQGQRHHRRVARPLRRLPAPGDASMSPGASLAVTHLTGVLDCGKSTLLVPAAEGPCGADTSEADHHLNGAIQTVALVEDRPIARRDLEIFLNLLKRTAGPRLLCLAG